MERNKVKTNKPYVIQIFARNIEVIALTSKERIALTLDSLLSAYLRQK